MDELGVSPEEIGTLARWVAFETIFGVLYRYDEPDLTEDDVSEMLQEQLSKLAVWSRSPDAIRYRPAEPLKGCTRTCLDWIQAGRTDVRSCRSNDGGASLSTASFFSSRHTAEMPGARAREDGGSPAGP
ncbi:hypothetical protein GCM10020220_108580 [Nonomuraea rubra]|uniref:hypothetical protein n=1 Tax=Nonomuraea rubra TaxID=46180 RepID=UPI0031EAADAE